MVSNEGSQLRGEQREEWRSVVGNPLYEVSNRARIRWAKSGRIRKLCPDHRGYPKVSLVWPSRPSKSGRRQRNVFVHILVAEAWVGPRPTPAHRVRHRDGVKHHCTPDNLLWGTQVENEADKRAHGTYLAGTRMYNAKLDPSLIQRARSLLDLGHSLRRVAREHLGVCHSTLSRALRGHTYREAV